MAATPGRCDHRAAATAVLRAALVAVVALLIGADGASAATSAGSQYEVTFTGTGNVDIHRAVQAATTETGEIVGTWQVRDSAARLRLPATAPGRSARARRLDDQRRWPAQAAEDPASGGYYGAAGRDGGDPVRPSRVLLFLMVLRGP